MLSSISFIIIKYPRSTTNEKIPKIIRIISNEVRELEFRKLLTAENIITRWVKKNRIRPYTAIHMKISPLIMNVAKSRYIYVLYPKHTRLTRHIIMESLIKNAGFVFIIIGFINVFSN
jgi:hypothetical protein